MAYRVKLDPGFIATSRGEDTFNAVVLGADGDIYFIPISVSLANELEEWAVDGRDDDFLDYLCDEHGLSDEDFYYLLDGMMND